LTFILLRTLVERPLGRYPERPEPGHPINTFPSYGMSDLDPLGGLRGIGEGMLFHPNAGIAGPSNSRYGFSNILYLMLFHY